MKGISKHVLLVSDDQAFYQSLEEMLQTNGDDRYDITCVYPLEKALDMLDQNDYSLVVLDLPHDSAYSQIAERVRSAFGRLPVILLSSSGYQQAVSAIRQGIQQVVDKTRADHDMMLQAILASIERSRMENELHMRDRILEAVNYAAEVFLTQPNWDVRLDEILARLGGATESDRVYIYQNVYPPDGELSARIFFEWCHEGVQPYSESPAFREIGYSKHGFTHWMEQLSQGRMVVADMESLSAANKKLIEALNVHSFIVVPIFNGASWWGLIGIEHIRKPKHWSTAEIDAVKTSASMVGAAIARQEAEEKMKYLATHDHLTGLPNRLLFADRYQQSVSRAARSGEKVGIICLDLDKFKLVNDMHGHPLGDRVLKQVGVRLSGCLRASDTCARIGGDEFGIIADCLRNENDLQTVMVKLTESLKEAIDADGTQIQISASMGASIYSDHGTDLETLLSAADKALYQIKGKPIGHKIFSKAEQYSLLEE